MLIGKIVAGRCFVGLGAAAANVITVNIVSDIFCCEYLDACVCGPLPNSRAPVHERGTFVGLATVALVNGPHFASLRG